MHRIPDPFASDPPMAPLPAPAWLPVDARQVWAEVEPLLRAADRLRPEHAEVLGNWCACAAELRELASVIAAEGSTVRGPHGTTTTAAHAAAVRLRATLVTLGKPLGLDPTSGAKLDRMSAPRPVTTFLEAEAGSPA